MSDTIDYEIKFFNINPIPEGGSIRINYPSTLTSPACVPSFGIEDISEAAPASCDVSGPPLVAITSFKQIKRNTLIQVVLRLTNPSGAGITSSSVTITTYADALGTNKIDEFTGLHKYDIQKTKPASLAAIVMT